MKKLILFLTVICATTYMSQAQTVYVNFEGKNLVMNHFADLTEVVANPFKTGINMSDSVGKLTRTSGGDQWDGFWAKYGIDTDSTKWFNITTTNKYVHVKIYYTDTTAIDSVVWHIESSGKPTHEWGSMIKKSNIKLNVWQDFVWDCSAFQKGYYHIIGLQPCRGMANKLKKDEIIYFDDFIVSDSPNPITSTLVNNPTKNNIEVYPNPFVSELRIKNVNNISSITIYNILGMKVISAVTNENSLVLDLNNLTSGAYIVSILENTGNVYTTKILKK
jgi:hypothetical protein